VEEIAPLLRDRFAENCDVFSGWVAALDGFSLNSKEDGRASHDAPISESRYGAPGSVARLPAWVRNEMKTVETEIKYSAISISSGARWRRCGGRKSGAIPGWFDYGAVSGLSSEMKQTLSRVRPQTLGRLVGLRGSRRRRLV